MFNNGSVVEHLGVGVLDLGQMSDWPDGLLERTSDVEERKDESSSKLECVFLWEEMGFMSALEVNSDF